MRPKVEWRVVSTEKDLPRSDHPVLVTYKHRGDEADQVAAALEERDRAAAEELEEQEDE